MRALERGVRSDDFLLSNVEKPTRFVALKFHPIPVHSIYFCVMTGIEAMVG